MPADRPVWPHTHKAWKTLKAGDKTSKYPNTGTGNALDKIESLYKKIKWAEFKNALSYYKKSDVGLQVFYKTHAKYINPFLKAVGDACKTIRKARGMPGGGRNFAARMEDCAKEFEPDGPYFNSLLGAYERLKPIKASIDSVAEKMTKLSIEQAIRGGPTYEIFSKYAKTAHIEENTDFLKAIFNKEDPYRTYKNFALEINISGPALKNLKSMYDSKKLKLAHFDGAVGEITTLLRTGQHWENAVNAWKNEQYKIRGVKAV
ncbi:hypothetical protein [Ereboglobus luteus]|uniref:Uncharacterized protein n=1 Tax=Ereboglobus luteus TaxID=1796921 RepID=A0A2U8E588_9BACT|nr:hypothetical protein [Ereboglobus luteus]AWI10023.1 hypothetical protein CKA38_12855 [Ereboglobus luteus]